MLRAGVAFYLAISFPLTSMAQVQGTIRSYPTTPQRPPQVTPISQIPDSVLEKYVGFEGREGKANSKDIELAIAELTARANTKRDGRAAFLLGREYQWPANPNIKADPKAAALWFSYGTQLGDPSAVDAFSMCLRTGYGGVAVDKARADVLAKWATEHGYAQNQDHQSIAYNQALEDQRAKQEQQQKAQNSDNTALWIGAAALIGLTALLSSGPSKSDKPESDKSSGANDSDGLLKRCTVTEWHMENGYSVPRQVPRVGFECP